MREVHLVLYVRDQGLSTDFYSAVLSTTPRLNVPGMTQFDLPGGALLGLMPERGIKKLLGETLPDPAIAAGTPRCELYLVVESASTCLRRALDCGARPLSPVERRDWGHRVGYCLDPDGHVLAFATKPRPRHSV